MRTVILIILLSATGLYAQVGINYDGSLPTSHSILDIKSDTTGMLIPRMTTIQRNTLSAKLDAAHKGMVVFDKTANLLFFWDGTEFIYMRSGVLSEIADTDNDTYISVEEGTDPDYINFSTFGTNFWRMENGRLEFLNTGGSVFIGENAGYSDDFSNNDNVFVGKDAGKLSTQGSMNVGLGISSLYSNQIGSYNVALGAYALQAAANTVGNNAMGGFAMYSNTAGNYNTAAGHLAMFNNATGSNNTAMGTQAMLSNTTGYSNVAIGAGALYKNTTRSHLVAIGDSALFNNGLGVSANGHALENTAVGTKTLMMNTTGSYNTGMGGQSLYSNTTGYSNSAHGYQALYANTTGLDNSAMGFQSLYANNTGVKNTASGTRALYGNDVGSENTAVGYHALMGNVSGNYNTALGVEAGSNASAGNNNVILGYKAGYNIHAASGNVFIGHKAGFYESLDNRLYIHNSDTTKPLIFGNFDSKFMAVNANMAIGTHTTLGKLHIHDPENRNATVYITPETTGSGDTSTVFFAEDHDATFGMYWMYDGNGNHMELWGKNGTLNSGPHLQVKRDNGDVAIGTDFASGYKLSVAGKVMCEELRVNLKADWPDYVFSEEYQLMLLNQLENYISINGHLPNIPPASNIEKSGLEVGETQRLMMEKIEELTLYIIEQQKQIEMLSGLIKNAKE
jgi:hypothetical protein